MWILGNLKKDLTYLVFPCFFIIVFSFLNSKEQIFNGLLLLITFHIIDSGHVYLTFFRTYANPVERKSSMQYILAPFIIFTIFLIWFLTKTPYIWHFIVYATIYHNIRQFYGITRWYQKKDRNFSPWPGRFIYALTILPTIQYHFRSNALTGLYSKMDIFHFPNEKLLILSLSLYSFTLMIWVIYEINQLIQKTFSLGRFLSMLTPISAYGIGLIFGHTLLQILGAIIVAHGIGYAALVAYSLKKIEPKKYKNFTRSLILFLGIAILAGTAEAKIENIISPLMEGINSSQHITLSLVASIYLTPLFCHYFFDSFLWKGNHREAHIIYN